LEIWESIKINASGSYDAANVLTRTKERLAGGCEDSREIAGIVRTAA
jgi:hypothetical protein